jgi:hypothetical protein
MTSTFHSFVIGIVYIFQAQVCAITSMSGHDFLMCCAMLVLIEFFFSCTFVFRDQNDLVGLMTVDI